MASKHEHSNCSTSCEYKKNKPQHKANEMSHTPTLRITKDGGIEDDRGVLIFMAVAPSSKQLGPQIVRAVNCHEGLMRVVEEMHREYMAHKAGELPNQHCSWCTTYAIANAEGK